MKCLSPIFIRAGSSVVCKDGNNVLRDGQYVPCGQCMACRLNYAKFWSLRMMEELKHHDKACFVTLTYAPEFCPDDLLKRDLQLFWKRLRKERKVRYFCCGERGDRFNRPHYHAIVYGISPDEKDLLEKHWQQGIVHVGNVTPDSCAYVAKYMTKKLRGKALQQKLEEDPDYQNEFVLMSRRPGIGGEPSAAMVDFMRNNGFVYRKGKMSSLPRYWKDKYDIEVDSVVPDYDEEQKHLQDYDKHVKLLDKRLKFFKRV